MKIQCPKCNQFYNLNLNKITKTKNLVKCKKCAFNFRIFREDDMMCPKCGKKYENGTIYCPYDGNELILALKLIPKCTVCDKLYFDNSKFCIEDGGKIVSDYLNNKDIIENTIKEDIHEKQMSTNSVQKTLDTFEDKDKIYSKEFNNKNNDINKINTNAPTDYEFPLSSIILINLILALICGVVSLFIGMAWVKILYVSFILLYTMITDNHSLLSLSFFDLQFIYILCILFSLLGATFGTIKAKKVSNEMDNDPINGFFDHPFFSKKNVLIYAFIIGGAFGEILLSGFYGAVFCQLFVYPFSESIAEIVHLVISILLSYGSAIFFVAYVLKNYDDKEGIFEFS